MAPERPSPGGPRRLAALGLAAEGVLVVHPVLAVSATFTGAGTIGKALAQVRLWDVAVQGLVMLVTPLTALLALLAAWGVWHGSRGVAALLLQLLVLPLALLPALRPLTLASHVPGGAWLLVGVAAATTLLLVVVVVSGGTPATARRWWRRRWWWVVGYAALVGAVALPGAASRDLPFDPTSWLAADGAGQAPPTDLVLGPHPAPQNPGMAPNPWGSIHNDSWATDAYAIPGPGDPREAPVDSLFTGGDCATLTFDSRGRLLTLCNTLRHVVAHVVEPRTLTVRDTAVVGTRSPDLTDFSGGGYFVLDDADRMVFPDSTGVITVLSAEDDELRTVDRIDVSGALQDGERITSLAPDWQRRIWFVGNRGTVGLVSSTGAPRTLTLAGEDIENSLAVTEQGALVVTGAALYLLRADDDGRPSVAWRTPYDTGSRQKPGQTSRASGTTPTVFHEGRHVAIADNADPTMHVAVFRTSDGVQTCAVPVFAAGRSATENSLVALGDTLVVENNYGYAPAVTATSGGHTTEPGLAGVRVDPVSGACRLAWQNDEVVVPSAVSKGTLVGELVLTYAKPGSRLGVDGWYFTAVDATTGEVRWTRLAGTGLSRNNHYAAAYLGPDGDLFVGTLSGIVVLRHG